jgi:sulfate adenylyltransferase
VIELISPHGGKLKQLLESGEYARTAIEEANGLKKVFVSSKEMSDLIMLGIGAYSPLDGFLCREDYESVVEDMRLSCGTLWPVPITLAVTEEVASAVREDDRIALYGAGEKEPLATMLVKDKFDYNRKNEAIKIFRTDDERHPAVQKLMQQGGTYLGGPVTVLSEGGYPENFAEYARPEETRAIFQKRGWRSVVAFQTRNPMHRSHEYITKVALEVVDGLLIHPIVGRLKEGDVPAEVRMRCYRAIVDNYYPKQRVIVKVYPMEMRYAGPREAVLHAIIRQNFGCTHFIVGRDHAGVEDYYGPFDAQKIFDTLDRNDIAIKPLKMDWTFWCERCGQMASSKTCPHPDEDHLVISGTELRRMLSGGSTPSVKFSRPEVLDILRDYYSKKGSGKET